MKPECGGCDSRVPRRAADAHRMETKYRRQSGLSEIDGGQERASEGLSSLENHVTNARVGHMRQDKLEPQGDFSFSHQSVHPPCSCIGIPGSVLPEPAAGNVGMMLEASWSLKRLAGADSKTDQPDYQDPHSVDTGASREEHETDGKAVLWSPRENAQSEQMRAHYF